ncbi:MAG: hypothetical protein ACFN9G_08860 [Cardiobacterium sp.]
MHRLYLTPQRWEKRCTKAAYAELLQQAKSRKAKNRKTLVVDADGFRERLMPKRPECYFDGSFSIHFEYSTSSTSEVSVYILADDTIDGVLL